MDRRQLSRWVFAAMMSAASLPAAAGECRPVLKDGWVRLPPVPDAHMLAGYGKIANPCKQAAALVSASSPAFMRVELHRSEVVDGVSRMREVPELPLAPESDTALEPGGLHLMLMHPSAPVKEGDKVAVTFKLKDGFGIAGELTVRKGAPEESHQHHGH